MCKAAKRSQRGFSPAQFASYLHPAGPGIHQNETSKITRNLLSNPYDLVLFSPDWVSPRRGLEAKSTGTTACPAVSMGAIFVRGKTHLFKIQAQ